MRFRVYIEQSWIIDAETEEDAYEIAQLGETFEENQYMELRNETIAIY